MGDSDDFPYQAEYAKSSRASCRKCQGNIEKGSLRLAVLIQSPSFDAKIPHWYHYMCFFAKQQPKSVQDISHFDSLRWDDQQKIKEKIEKGGSSTPQGLKKSGKNGSKVDKTFSVEYAKTRRAACKGCEEKIEKGDIRISKKDYESEKAKRFGPIPMWHHVDCFVNLRNELEFFGSVESLPGFNTLGADDKKMLRSKIRMIAGKRKVEDEPDSGAKKQKTENENLQEKQNKKLFYYRDLLEKNLKKAELASLLEHNDYPALSGDKMLDVLADLMTFGNTDKCSVCKNGNFIHRFGIGYVCNGSISEWTKCTNVLEKPKRSPFTIPKELKEAFEFLKKYKYKKFGDRVITKRESKQDLTTSESSASKTKPLEDLTFVILGTKFKIKKEAIRQKVESLGGQISSKVEATTAAIITTPGMIEGKSKQMKMAKTLSVECVSEDFLDEVEPDEPDGALLMIKKKNIAPWDSTVEERLKRLKKCKSSYKSKMQSGSKYELDLPDTVQITLKNGSYVDPKSGLADCCHVYKRDGKNYTVVLCLVDLARGINSYYRLQVLESDDKKSWYLYRSWGRIGTTVGDHKVEHKQDLLDAMTEFKSLYEKKTGNKFLSKTQEKLSGMWYPLDIVFGEEKKFTKLKVGKSKSKLHVAIQELISLLFDVDAMKSTMVHFELDLKKMPLGKLSPKQLENAYKVLSEAMEWIEKRDQKESDTKSKVNPVSIKSHLLDCSNRFYTLIPHDFGMKNPPLLDNEALIKSKIEMIDSLREIELAYSLLKSEDGSEGELDPIDVHYKKLKTNMEVLDKSSKDFDMIKTYVKNTHAATHSHYELEVDEVFKIEREGEMKRFKPFKKLHNRQLLWHGSRLTNFVGILSQGLRIAPPEAPATGYMFGKGVYFADMVSKSANYCFTSKTNSTGLLLLSEVALGEMYELMGAKYVTKLPSGKHSTKGLGSTCPDPAQTITLEDGVKVPLGDGKSSEVKRSSLLYNEYIVYDVSQINIKYLLKTTFKYKY